MPTRRPTLDVRALRAHLAETIFATRPAGDDHFGIEVELIPFDRRAGGPRPRHVPLHRPADGDLGSLEVVSTFARRHGLKVKTPEGHLTGACPPPLDGDITFEPGGQVEWSCAPRPTPALAYEESATIIDGLIRDAAVAGIDLVTIGFNPWLGVDEIGLNTQAPRYRSMDAVYQTIGPYGRRKMRQSATIHVNLDFGGAERQVRRWQAAQLLAPLALATFAYSPIAEGRVTGFRSFRGRVWTDVDPSRCGFPAGFLADPASSPVDQYLAFALDARVLMVEADGRLVAQTEPLAFRSWLEDGWRGLYPTLDEWSNHLTTLFPDVRPRGFLELRSADSQARAFWSVPLTWWTALLCDDAALEQVIDLLWDGAPGLNAQYLAAAEHGVADPAIGDRAAALYRLALAALERLPDGYVTDETRRAFEHFGERFTLARRTPADELLERVARHGLAWSTLSDLGEEWCRAVHPETCAGSRELPLIGDR